MIKKREAVRQDGLPYFVCRDTAGRRAARPAIRLKAERGTYMLGGTTFANEKKRQSRVFVFLRNDPVSRSKHISREDAERGRKADDEDGMRLFEGQQRAYGEYDQRSVKGRVG